ncbi:MAG: TonB-dependent receptor [Pseudomonadota bacterium]
MKAIRFLSATALASAALAIPGFAAAQSTPAPQAAASDEASDTIVVTGSRIRRPNDEASVPITTVTAAEIFQSGRISVADTLNDLPQLRSTVSSQNSTSGLGVRGLNLLDLRGLGTARTLVLVNGRRHVSAEIINNNAAPDINTFPTDLIERVDIVTGGTSSIYGSDAIAGTVNFILKDNFDGFQVHGQAGVSRYNDAGNQYLSGVIGKNFADGRGNIALNVEYAHQQDYYGSARPNLAQNDAFLVVETDKGTIVNGSDGISDRLFFRDIRSTTISNGGQIGVRMGTNAPCGKDGDTGAAWTCAYLFQPDGSLIAQTGTRVGIGPNGSFIGGNGNNSREGNFLVLSPDVKRYAFNLIGHFEISPAFVPFIEAKYVRTEAFGSQSGPFFSQGQTLGDGITVTGLNDRSYASTTTAPNGTVNREGIRLDNPYLSAQARAILTAQFTDAINNNINPNTGAAFTTTGTTAAQSQANKALLLAQIANGSFRFSSRRNYVDLGYRDEQIKRDTYRIVGGVRGNFNDDWNYELSFNYGQHDETNNITGALNRQRFLLAQDTVRNTAGQIVCRAQVDPNYAVTIANATGTTAQKAAILAADIAACVPLNPFGEGSVSAAAKNYVLMPITATGRATQFVASGFVAGDLSQLFELPGGPVGFSVGAEYRRETLSYDLDPTTQAGYSFYNAIPSFVAPSFEVKEAFGELSVPIVKDVPFFKELTLTGSGRVADYKGGTGTVYAYSGGVEWAPVSDIRFRGAYSRSVRAPYLGDLYSTPGQNFAPAFTDPCSARNINSGSSTRAANCAAAGRPSTYDYVYSSSLEIVSGGNPNLKAETSNSITVGGVLRPRWVPGLSISADYYDIQVDNVIAAVSAQNIVNLCYDSPTLTNAFCGMFTRAGASGGARGEEQFRILEGSLLQSGLNFAKRIARGIDVNGSYNTNFDWGSLALKGIYTHVFKRENYTSPTDPTFVDVLLNELGDPEDQFNLSADLKIHKLTLGYSFRWIGPMYLNTYEDYNSVNGGPPQNVDYADIVKYPIVTYSDVRFDYDINNRFNFYGGINNLFDTMPPYGLTGVGAGSAIYDNRGRFMYMGFKAKF